MSFGTTISIVLTKKEYDDLKSFCDLNNLKQDKVVKDSYSQGFRIEKYGLLTPLGDIKERVVEKEIIKEVPVEKVVEVIKEVQVDKIVEKIVEKPIEVIKEVPVEKVIEVVKEIIKEVPVEKVVVKEVINEVPVEKIVYVTDQEEMRAKIFQKEQDFEEQRKMFSTKADELEKNFQERLEKKDEELDELRRTLDELSAKLPVEKIVEVVKEIPVEKDSSDLKNKFELLQQTLIKLRSDIIEKDKKIKENEITIETLKKNLNDIPATFLRGSNLDDKLYK